MKTKKRKFKLKVKTYTIIFFRIPYQYGVFAICSFLWNLSIFSWCKNFIYFPFHLNLLNNIWKMHLFCSALMLRDHQQQKRYFLRHFVPSFYFNFSFHLKYRTLYVVACFVCAHFFPCFVKNVKIFYHELKNKLNYEKKLPIEFYNRISSLLLLCIWLSIL